VCGHDEAHVRKPLKELMEGLDPDIFGRSIAARWCAPMRLRAQRDDMGRYLVELHGSRKTQSQSGLCVAL
jgi:hypothetical protein